MDWADQEHPGGPPTAPKMTTGGTPTLEAINAHLTAMDNNQLLRILREMKVSPTSSSCDHLDNIERGHDKPAPMQGNFTKQSWFNICPVPSHGDDEYDRSNVDPASHSIHFTVRTTTAATITTTVITSAASIGGPGSNVSRAAAPVGLEAASDDRRGNQSIRAGTKGPSQTGQGKLCTSKIITMNRNKPLYNYCGRRAF